MTKEEALRILVRAAWNVLSELQEEKLATSTLIELDGDLDASDREQLRIDIDYYEREMGRLSQAISIVDQASGE